jgi:hypothetical protein
MALGSGGLVRQLGQKALSKILVKRPGQAALSSSLVVGIVVGGTGLGVGKPALEQGE